MKETRLFSWWREADADARRSLFAASCGWLLDAFDIMLFSMVTAALITHLDTSKATIGVLNAATLIASAIGGMIFGVIADRFGRTRALIGSILIYSVMTAACGFAQTVVQLAVLRFFLGLGMGGEWASGASLVSETWPPAHRGKALGLMQSSWAVGYALAALVAWIVLPRFGWRYVFFVGVLPAFFTVWVQKRVREPEIWLQRRRERPAAAGVGIGRLFGREFRGITIAVTTMNALTMFAWWGFNLWVPAYLSLPRARGGAGFSSGRMSLLIIVMQVGMWFGYITFGFVSDRFGRKKTYVVYLLCAAAALLVYSRLEQAWALLMLGPVTAFFGTGHFTGFGALTAELYPTEIRATAQGLTYNFGRIVSALAPFLIGSMADRLGFPFAFAVTSCAFVLAAGMWWFIPETRKRELR